MRQTTMTAVRLLTIGAVCAVLLCALMVRAHAGLGIVVRTAEGTEYSFDPEPTDRVEDLKAWLEKASGVPYAGIRLFFEGKELREGNTLQDYSISKNSVLRMERKAAILPGVEALTGPRLTVTDQGSWQQPTAFVAFGEDSAGAPILWRVLDNGGNAVFLLTEQLQAEDVPFDSEYDSTWEGSAAEAWCKNFAENSLSSAERGAVLPTSREEEKANLYGEYFWGSSMVDDQVFFLSANELNAYVANYECAPGLVLGSYWWLRSPGWNQNTDMKTPSVGIVFDDGRVGSGDTKSGRGARPALNLDGSKVLFASEAEGGKGSGQVSWLLDPVKEYGGGAWKLTLLDSSRPFSATATVPDVLCSGDTIDIQYSGFTAGEGEYVSAALVDADGNWLYYGAIARGTESVNPCVILPDELQPGSYTLLLFSEQRRAGALTDLASTPVEVELNVVHRHQWADTWSWDDLSHWHACLDPDCPAPAAKKDNTLHSFRAVVSDEYLVTAGGCTEPSTYYRSCVCGKADQRTFTQPAPGHQPQKVEAVAPTQAAAGNREYWYCAGCGGRFADEGCTVPLTKEEVTLPKLPASGGQTSGGSGAAPPPTATPVPAQTPAPPASPKPSATPRPAGTASPGPAPSATPAPAASAAPSASPEATAAPSPTPAAAQAATEGGGFAPALLLVPAAAIAGGVGLWWALAKRRNKGSE